MKRLNATTTMASDPRSSAETDQKVPPELRASINVEWMRIVHDCRALQPPRCDRYRQFFSFYIYVRVILDQHVPEARTHPITTSWSTYPHRVHHGLRGSAVLRLNVVHISSALASSCLASRTSCGFPTAPALTPSSFAGRSAGYPQPMGVDRGKERMRKFSEHARRGAGASSARGR